MSELRSVNPATGELLASYPVHREAERDDLLATAAEAAAGWRYTAMAERSALVRRVAEILDQDADRLARLATAEMGKTISEARAEVAKCARACRFYAERAPEMLADQVLASAASHSYVAYRPLGPVLAVMPWNFPYWQVFRFAAPALMAGNAPVLKHAANVSGVALAIADVVSRAGGQPGLFTTLLVPSEQLQPVIADPRIAAVTLTGSVGAGRAVAAAAGAVLKKTVLELGGSDFFIVLDDADIEEAARIGVASRFQNAGQSCIAAKRFIVTRRCAGDFTEALRTRAAALVVGDPTQEETRMGPLARADLRDSVHEQVAKSLAQGAGLALGGEIPAGPGAFYPPTVLTSVTPEMPVLAEEVFGPVAPVWVVADEAEAIRAANDTPFGLGGNLWTADVERAQRLAARLHTGGVFINGMTASDPRLPFGGVKESGYGRELSALGLREFVNAQTVWIGPDTGPAGAANVE